MTSPLPDDGPIRVLVVDDMVVFRTAVSHALRAAGDMEVVGTAGDGRQALERIERLRPDVVTLDVEMPELDGLGTLAEIRKRWPELPVVMFSSVTESGSVATLDALERGANDFALKPAKVTDRAAAIAAIEQSLVTPVRHWGRAAHLARRTRARTAPAPASAAPRPAPSTGGGPVDGVVVAVSTGGPSALQRVLSSLPARLPVPVVVVQHMPPVFTKALAERLDGVSPLRVVEASDGMTAEPGTVYLAPGGQHLVLRREGARTVLRLDDGPTENSCKPAADVTFRAAAQVWGDRVLAVVLTGMGHDGAAGAAVIRSAGGRVWAQDEQSSVVWGMPGSVAPPPHADLVLPLADVAPALAAACSVTRSSAAQGLPA